MNRTMIHSLDDILDGLVLCLNRTGTRTRTGETFGYGCGTRIRNGFGTGFGTGF
jgi:hypothetical protein